MEEKKEVDTCLTVVKTIANPSPEAALGVDGLPLQRVNEIKIETEVKPIEPVISIPGFSTIFSQKVRLSRRIAWAIIVIAVTIGATIQVN